MPHLTRFKMSIIFAFVFFNVYCAQAFQGDINPSNVKFKRILAEHDIALGAIYDVIQDRQGFIWIGGMGGLVRYDGYTLKVVGQSGDANNAIKRVHDIYEDKQNNLWLATSYGLIKYNMLTEEHVRYTDQSPTLSLSNNYVMKVTGSPNGEILAATWAGINIISPDSTAIKVVYPDVKIPASHPVMALQFDVNKRLWVGTSQGLYYQNWQSNNFTRVVSNTRLDSAEVKALAFGINKLWVGTNKGLYELDVASKNYVSANTETLKAAVYRHNVKDIGSLSADLIWSLLFDKQGLLWVATDQGGLDLFDAETKTFIHYKNNSASSTSLVTNTVKALLQDNNGDIWTGHFPTGVSYFNRSTTVATLYTPNPLQEGSLSHNSVMAFAEDTDNIWVGTDGGGLNRLNRKNGRFRVFKASEHENSLQSNAVLALLNTGDKTLWVGTWGGGLASIDLSNQKITRHTLARNKDGSAKTLSVWSLYQDSDNNLWVGTQFSGLYRYQPSTQTVQNFAPSAASDSLAANEVWTMLEDKHGRFWVGTSAGLNLMDRKAGTFSVYKNVPNDVNSLSQNSVESLFEDNLGQLWVGTAGGLNRWNATTKSFKRFTKADGLVDDVIKSIVQDSSNTLWLGTSNGLSTINPSTAQLKNYRPHIGWQKGAFNANASWLTRDNTLMFGGENGLMAFSPKGIEKSAYQAPIVFTNLSLDAKSVAVARDSVLINVLSAASQITIESSLQMFSVDFALLSYRGSNKNQYAYRLKGFDNAWREVGVQHSATYTNLSKGEYTLEVKAANYDGNWNSKAATLGIRIQ